MTVRDAVGVRRANGLQAALLNKLGRVLSEKGIIEFKAIKEVCDDVAFRYSETLFTDSTPFARRKIPTTTIELKKGDNELSSAYDKAFKSALNVTVDTMKYMQERQQLFRGEKTIM